MRAILAFLLAFSFSISACTGPEQMDRAKHRVRSRYPSVSHVSVNDLSVWLAHDSTPMLRDVRTRGEFAVSHLKGARHAESLEELLGSLEGMPKDTRVVLYCSIGGRSSRRAQELEERGFTNVYNLEGSIFEWANRGLPVYRDGVEVRDVHPHHWWWGRMLNEELRAKKSREDERSAE